MIHTWKVATWIGIALLLTACGVQPSYNAPQQTGMPVGYTSVTGPLPSQTANGVRLTVHTIEVQEWSAGYAQVVLDLTLSNDAPETQPESVCAGNLILVDTWSNTYANWYGWSADLPDIIPACISTHETTSGYAVFRVPVAALSQALRLRWESKLTRVEVLLPTDLTVPSPAGAN